MKQQIYKLAKGFIDLYKNNLLFRGVFNAVFLFSIPITLIVLFAPAPAALITVYVCALLCVSAYCIAKGVFKPKDDPYNTTLLDGAEKGEAIKIEELKAKCGSALKNGEEIPEHLIKQKDHDLTNSLSSVAITTTGRK